MKKIKNTSMFLLWAGAAISISEIYTGGLIAPLGLVKGLTAIVLGHIIGTLFLAFGGYISFTDNKNAMDKVRDSLGPVGSKITALLNVLQLLGWSAIMIIQGGRALNSVFPGINYYFCLVFMAAAVFLWAFYFNNYSKLVNDSSVVILLIICGFMLFNIKSVPKIALSGSISFTTALELAIAMPVSWLPLIGDYSKDGESKLGVFMSSFWGYFIGSVLMYILGFLITLNTGKDIVEFIAGSQIKIAACLIIVLSTVTTTFIDIYSAVVSSKQFIEIKNENTYIIIYSLLAALLAFFFPIESYQNFLLIIGGVFIPVYTVVFSEYLIAKGKSFKMLNVTGLILCVLGTGLYTYFTNISFGSPTLLVIAIVSVLYVAVQKLIIPRRILE